MIIFFYSNDLFHLAIPIKPKGPEPNSQTAAGAGTGGANSDRLISFQGAYDAYPSDAESCPIKRLVSSGGLVKD